jgi:hypothetical protein
VTALALCVPVQASSLLPLSMKRNASPATGTPRTRVNRGSAFNPLADSDRVSDRIIQMPPTLRKHTD